MHAIAIASRMLRPQYDLNYQLFPSLRNPVETPASKPNPIVERFPQLFGGLLSLSLALVVGAYLGSSAIRTLSWGKDALTVIGSAKRPIRSDYIIWRSSVTSQQSTLQQAYQEIKRHTERVQAYLKSKNVPADAITLNAIDTQPVPEVNANGVQTGRTQAYRLTQRFEIRSNDVDGIGAISRSSTELINEGIPFTSEAPEYLYTQLSQLRVEMIAEAAKDAKARAEAITRQTGGRIGVVRNAETDVFQITSRNSTEVSNSGSYNTSSLEKDITAVVSITFAMEQ
jgi:hypothetical protein